jgi:hypothetical protein
MSVAIVTQLVTQRGPASRMILSVAQIALTSGRAVGDGASRVGCRASVLGSVIADQPQRRWAVSVRRRTVMPGWLLPDRRVKWPPVPE